jgi:neutral ceramidase
MSAGPAETGVPEQGPRDCAPSGLLAGVARADISPPLGIAQMMWGAATHIESAGIDPAGMFATAVAFSSAQKTQVIVAVDTADMSEEFSRTTIERAAARTGIDPDHILLNSSHTHSSPRVAASRIPVGQNPARHIEDLERYQHQLADKIVGTIVAAQRALQPVHLHGGRGVGTININRRFRARAESPPAVGRNPEGFVDRELVVFRVDDAAGKPIAILVNFQAHPTVLSATNKVISPDYIGGVRQAVETAFPGALCLFLQGAAGDQGPVEGFTGDLRVAHRLGHILGHQVAAVAEQIETVEREPHFEGFAESSALQAREPWRVKGARDATMGFLASKVDVPRREYSDEEVAAVEASRQRAAEQLAKAERDGDERAKHVATVRMQRYANLLRMWKLPPKRPRMQVDLQAIRIGELAVVAMAAQPFAQIGAIIKERSPFAHTMFVGFADGTYDGSTPGGYMPTSDEYRYGGYEVDMTPYGPGADTAVIEAASTLLHRLKQGD